VELVNGEPIVEAMRAVKSAEEIKGIQKAAAIAELGMKTAIGLIRPGIRECDIMTEAEYFMRKEGGRLSTLNYFGSGMRSCIAHHTPSEKKIEAGDVVTIDIHGAFRGYCADLARTVLCGKMRKDVAKAHDLLHKAQEESLRFCTANGSLRSTLQAFYRVLRGAKPLRFLTGRCSMGSGS